MTTLYRQLHKSATHKQGNDPACPVCQRHVKMGNLLSELGARQLSSVDGPIGSTLSFYLLPNGITFILQWYAEDAGFEMYGPLAHSNRVEDTFFALSQLAAQVAA